ncbi:uncharacterized protein LOC131427836, partial [Malaya genurostris]|uniref:uncharacterized protein LOC131427836 n=1 Tax=Malaya genurostris TaxID=325434 RepID=UPI0026F3F41B
SATGPLQSQSVNFKLDNSIVNRYLSAADDEFVWAVDQDIREFVQKGNQKSVLIFPPVNNYRRFLIHKVSESLTGDHQLVTFSIGVGGERRTVVCYRHQLLRDVKATSSKSFEESTDGTPLSWRSTTVGPTSVTTLTTSNTVSGSDALVVSNSPHCSSVQNSCCSSVASNNSNFNCTSTTKSVASGGGNVGKKRTKRDSAANAGDGTTMGVDAAAFTHGHNHQTNSLFSVNSEYGTLKIPSLASSPPSATAGSKLSSVGIYRPPAVRKALKLSDNVVQLAPPAACEHPSNDYGLAVPQHTHKQYVTVALSATAATTTKSVSPAVATTGTSSGTSLPGVGSCTGTTDSSKHSCYPGKVEENYDCVKGDISASLNLALAGDKPVADDSDLAQSLADRNNNNSNNEPAQQLEQSTNAVDTSQGNSCASDTRPARLHRERRPDRAVYIPRARRSQTTPPVTAQLPQQQHQLVQQQQSSTTSSSTNAFCLRADAPTPSVSAAVTSGISYSLSFPPKAARKERSSHGSTDKDHKSKTKDKPPPADCNSVIGNHSSNDCRTDIRSEYSNTALSFGKNRSHSVEEGVAKTGIDQEIVKLKKQKSEEAPRENAFAQGCDLVPKSNSKKESSKRERSASSISGEVVNGSTNPKAVDSMNKSNKHRSAKQQSTAAPLIINGTEVADKLDRDEKELRRASQEINRSNRRIIKQTFASDVLEISEQVATEKIDQANGQTKSEATRQVNPEEDDWESIYDDNGDCLNPKLMEELTSAVGKVSIEVPKSDYKLYQSKHAALNEEEFPHVLEVSNFPVEFKTQDLMMLFSQYKESGFDIKWVDDTHALAVFSSSKIAAEVLANGHTFVKLKPLAEATVESRSKARKCSSSLQPYRPRPETCAALARRLVTTALGVRLKTAPEERENERRVLREAKERKLLAAKQRDEIWES